MITLGALAQGGQEALVEAHGDDLPRPVADRLTSPLAKAVHVVALLGLIDPLVDVLLSDGFPVDPLHARSVLRK